MYFDNLRAVGELLGCLGAGEGANEKLQPRRRPMNRRVPQSPSIRQQRARHHLQENSCQFPYSTASPPIASEAYDRGGYYIAPPPMALAGPQTPAGYTPQCPPTGYFWHNAAWYPPPPPSVVLPPYPTHSTHLQYRDQFQELASPTRVGEVRVPDEVARTIYHDYRDGVRGLERTPPTRSVGCRSRQGLSSPPERDLATPAPQIEGLRSQAMLRINRFQRETLAASNPPTSEVIDSVVKSEVSQAEQSGACDPVSTITNRSSEMKSEPSSGNLPGAVIAAVDWVSNAVPQLARDLRAAWGTQACVAHPDPVSPQSAALPHTPDLQVADFWAPPPAALTPQQHIRAPQGNCSANHEAGLVPPLLVAQREDSRPPTTREIPSQASPPPAEPQQPTSPLIPWSEPPTAHVDTSRASSAEKVVQLSPEHTLESLTPLPPLLAAAATPHRGEAPQPDDAEATATDQEQLPDTEQLWGENGSTANDAASEGLEMEPPLADPKGAIAVEGSPQDGDDADAALGEQAATVGQATPDRGSVEAAERESVGEPSGGESIDRGVLVAEEHVAVSIAHVDLPGDKEELSEKLQTSGGGEAETSQKEEGEQPQASERDQEPPLDRKAPEEVQSAEQQLHQTRLVATDARGVTHEALVETVGCPDAELSLVVEVKEGGEGASTNAASAPAGVDVPPQVNVSFDVGVGGDVPVGEEQPELTQPPAGSDVISQDIASSELLGDSFISDEGLPAEELGNNMPPYTGRASSPPSPLPEKSACSVLRARGKHSPSLGVVPVTTKQARKTRTIGVAVGNDRKLRLRASQGGGTSVSRMQAELFGKSEALSDTQRALPEADWQLLCESGNAVLVSEGFFANVPPYVPSVRLTSQRTALLVNKNEAVRLGIPYNTVITEGFECSSSVDEFVEKEAGGSEGRSETLSCIAAALQQGSGENAPAAVAGGYRVLKVKEACYAIFLAAAAAGRETDCPSARAALARSQTRDGLVEKELVDAHSAPLGGTRLVRGEGQLPLCIIKVGGAPPALRAQILTNISQQKVLGRILAPGRAHFSEDTFPIEQLLRVMHGHLEPLS